MRWKVYRSQPGASGRKSMQAFSPGYFDMEENYASISPRLDYFIKFEHSGIHYLWGRGHAGGDTASDAFHAGLDGFALAEAMNISFDGTDEWKWSDTTATRQLAVINIPQPGVHVLNIWVKETGFVLDKLVLTTDSLYVPADMGPDESGRVLTGIEAEDNPLPLPEKFHLNQNYPNPFNPVTTIGYTLPAQEKVRLQVFDINGRLVRTLVDARQNAGTYQYDFKAEKIASGLYFYRINAGSFAAVKKMLLVR